MFGRNKKWLGIITLVLVAIVGVVYFMFFRGGSKKAEPTPTPTAMVEEVTPTTEPAIAKEDLKIKILNGSGVVGEAGRVKTILEKAGYKIESTDNAESYDHKETEIQAKTAVTSTVLDELKKLLEKDYTVTTSKLEKDNEVDIIVTVGSRINPPTSAPKATPKPSSPTGAQTQVTPTVTKTVTPTITPSPTKAV